MLIVLDCAGQSCTPTSKRRDECFSAGCQVLPVNLDVPLFSKGAVNMSLTDLSAAQAVEMLCARDITAMQYASASLAKAHEWECINAWSEIDPAKVGN